MANFILYFNRILNHFKFFFISKLYFYHFLKFFDKKYIEVILI